MIFFWKEEHHQTHTHLCFLFLHFGLILRNSYTSIFLADHRLSQLSLLGKPWAAFIERALQEQKMCAWDDWKVVSGTPRCGRSRPLIWAIAWSPLFFFCHRIKPLYLVWTGWGGTSTALVSRGSWSTCEMRLRGVNSPTHFRIPRSLGTFCGRTETVDVTF